MQITPDWQKQYDVAGFEKDFQTYLGPGFYLTQTDTVLVTTVPIDGMTVLTVENIWNHSNGFDGQMLHVAVYNQPFANTIFSALAIAPTRRDTRR